MYEYWFFTLRFQILFYSVFLHTALPGASSASASASFSLSTLCTNQCTHRQTLDAWQSRDGSHLLETGNILANGIRQRRQRQQRALGALSATHSLAAAAVFYHPNSIWRSDVDLCICVCVCVLMLGGSEGSVCRRLKR